MKITKSQLREIIREEIAKNKDRSDIKGTEAYKRAEWKGRFGSMKGFDKAFPQYAKNKKSVKEGEVKINEGLLTEATRSYVGIVDKNGKIISTYVHYDGYPAGVGMVLKNHFKNPAKIKQLLKTDGGVGISSLEKGIDGGEGHSFEKPVDGQTVFYGRDRGEKDGKFLKGDEKQVWHLVSSARKGGGAEYVYLYDMKDKKWYYTRTAVKLGTDVDAVNKLVEL
jgi:hypothetical protein